MFGAAPEYNPWTGEYTYAEEPASSGEGDKADWYSPYQQFSPPYIQYQAATLHETTYTMCDFQTASDENTEAGTARFVQFQGYPVQAKISLSGLDTETEYKIVINELGVLGDMCAEVGLEYNPLKEIDAYGRQNPFQDPSRGRIDAVVSGVDGTAEAKQAKVL